MKKIIITFLCLAFILVLSPLPSQAQVSQGSTQTMVSQLVDQEVTHIGLLPDSKLYFLKTVKEAVVGLVFFGNSKTHYLADLSQLRLKEAAKLTNKNEFALVNKNLQAYNGLIKKIVKRKYLNSSDSVVVLATNTNFIQIINIRIDENAANIDSALMDRIDASRLEMNNLNEEIATQIYKTGKGSQTK